MNTIQAHFANHLGKKICYKFGTEQQKILYVDAVKLDNIVASQSITGVLINLEYKDCMLVFEDRNEVAQKDIPVNICLISNSSGQLNPIENKKSNNDISSELLNILCDCTGVTVDELMKNNKNRSLSYKWPRQIKMCVNFKLFGFSLAKSALEFGQDHATCLNAYKRINSLIETDHEFREIFRDAFKYLHNEFGYHRMRNAFEYIEKFEF